MNEELCSKAVIPCLSTSTSAENWHRCIWMPNPSYGQGEWITNHHICRVGLISIISVWQTRKVGCEATGWKGRHTLAGGVDVSRGKGWGLHHVRRGRKFRQTWHKWTQHKDKAQNHHLVRKNQTLWTGRWLCGQRLALRADLKLARPPSRLQSSGFQLQRLMSHAGK